MTSAKDKKEIDKTVAQRDKAIKDKVAEAKQNFDVSSIPGPLPGVRIRPLTAPHQITGFKQSLERVPQLPRWNCYSPAVDFALILTGFGLGMTVTQFVERFL